MAREAQLNLVDRIIFGAIALLVVALALVLAMSAFGYQGVGSVYALAGAVSQRPLETVIAAVVLTLTALHLLFFALQKESDDGIRQETEIGHVRISLRAVENLVYRTAREVQGIKDVEATVRPSPEGVAILISLVVHPNLPIPRISDEVTQRVRTQVRETVGVDVGDVSIDIRNISDEGRARVE